VNSPRPPLGAEALKIGESIDLGTYEITKEEIVAYASKWDPLPMHVDEKAGAASHFGQIIASGMHTLAIMQLLSVLGAYRHWDVVAGRSISDLSLLRPVLPGMTLQGYLAIDDVERRPSGRWIVHHVNTLSADGQFVLQMHQGSVVRTHQQ
jgi:acyl dehydratase